MFGTFDLTPLDFKTLTSPSISALLWTNVMMGLGFKPDMINNIIASMEPPVKTAIEIFVRPITWPISKGLAGLTFLIDELEKAMKEYHKVVDKVEKILREEFAKALDKITQAQKKLQELENQRTYLKRRIDHYYPIAHEPCSPNWGKCCCFKIFGHRICLPTIYFTNSGCIGRLPQRIGALIIIVACEIARALLWLLKEAANALLELAKKIVKAAMDAIIALLKIPEGILLEAKAALEVAAKALALLIKPFAQFDIFKPCIGCIRFDDSCFWAAFHKCQLLRIFEIAC